MSDHPSVQDAMSFRLGLQRCNGAPGCPCQSSSSSIKGSHASASSSPSPSGSRTRSSSDSGSSSGHSDSPPMSPSPESSDSAVPEGEAVQEWSGLDSVTLGQCEHGRRAVLKKCVSGKHTGRRYLRCPLQDEGQQCQFMEWVEEAWPERVQTCLKQLWNELKTTRRCEATANSSLIEALQIKEVATEANANLVKKINRTKLLAHKVCAHYHTKAAVAVKHKNILLNLIYCLIGVIAVLVAIIVYLAK